MRVVHFVVAMAVVFPAMAQDSASDPRGRPMHEMHGDCANYRTDLSREFGLWQRDAATIRAISAGQNPSGVVSPDQRTTIELLPSPQVRFDVKPGEDRGKPDNFSGSVTVAALPSGLWRVSASNGVWIDLVGGGALLASPTFEMQSKCATIFKTVTFAVPGGAALTLQLSGSPRPAADVMITRVP